MQRKATSQTSEHRTLRERGIALELGCAGIVQRYFECVPKIGKAFSAAEELDEGTCHHVAIGGGGSHAQMIAALNDAEHPKIRSATAMAAALLPNTHSNGASATLNRLVCMQNRVWHHRCAASWPSNYVGYGYIAS